MDRLAIASMAQHDLGRALERAYARHDLRLRWHKIDAMLRNIRPDPRLAALLKKMNFPPD